jgi:DNA-binding transcriptional MocR family regulator
MFFWLRLPDGVSSKQVMTDALEEKVLVLPGMPFFPNRHSQDDAFLRLSFARLSLEEIQRAVHILSDVIRRRMT